MCSCVFTEKESWNVSHKAIGGLVRKLPLLIETEMRDEKSDREEGRGRHR